MLFSFREKKSKEAADAMEKGAQVDKKQEEQGLIIEGEKKFSEKLLAWSKTIHGVPVFRYAKKHAPTGLLFLVLAAYAQVRLYPWSAMAEDIRVFDQYWFFSVMFLRILCFQQFVCKESLFPVFSIFWLAVYGVYDQACIIRALCDHSFDQERLAFALPFKNQINVLWMHVSQVDHAGIMATLSLVFHVYTTIVSGKCLVAFAGNKCVKHVEARLALLDGKKIKKETILREFKLPLARPGRQSIIRTAMGHVVLSTTLLFVLAAISFYLAKWEGYKAADGALAFLSFHLATEFLVLGAMFTVKPACLLPSIVLQIIMLVLYIMAFINDGTYAVSNSGLREFTDTALVLGALFMLSTYKINSCVKCFNYIFASWVYNTYLVEYERINKAAGKDEKNPLADEAEKEKSAKKPKMCLL